ncbi:hypothetical protein IMSAGC018_00401 [Lachnospiraceae bacterium]|nr:hypothetical protein IMSAGC018_00401 [Lachnospiraceae bacterium]
MRKKLVALMALALVLSLCACEKNNTSKELSNKDADGENTRSEVSNVSQESAQPEDKPKTTAFERYFKDEPFWVQDENGLYGFIDQNGNYVIEPQFYNIGDKYDLFSFGVAFVQDNENMPKLWGLIDTSGNYILEPTFSDVGKFTSDELAYVQDKESGLYGYIDPTGTYQIEPQFTEARPFIGGLAIVSKGYGYIYVDTSGEIVISGGFEEANDFCDDLAAVKSWGAWGYIDRSGVFVIQPIYDTVYSFSDGVAFVHDMDSGDGYSLIDTDGNYIIKESIYTPESGTPNDGENAAKWIEGLCCVFVRADDSYPELGFGYAYINKNGEKVLPKDSTYYDKTWGFVESDSGTYAVATDHASGLYGYIDLNGEWVVSPQYSDGFVDRSPYNGIGLVDEAKAYIDMSGNVLAKVDAPLSFVSNTYISNTYNINILSAVSDDGKYGYVYADGSVALDFIYDAGSGFAADGSYAIVQYEGLYGAIDMDGNWLIPAEFKSMQAIYAFYQK